MKTASLEVEVFTDDNEKGKKHSVPVALTTTNKCLWSIMDLGEFLKEPLNAAHYPGAVTVPVEKNGKTVALAMAPLTELFPPEQDWGVTERFLLDSLVDTEQEVCDLYNELNYNKVDLVDLKTIFAETCHITVPFVPPARVYPYRPNTIRATRDKSGKIWFCAFDIDYANGMSGTSASYVCRNIIASDKRAKVMVIPGVEKGCVAAWCVTTDGALEIVTRNKFVKATTPEKAKLWRKWFGHGRAEVAYESAVWAAKMEDVPKSVLEKEKGMPKPAPEKEKYAASVEEMLEEVDPMPGENVNAKEGPRLLHRDFGVVEDMEPAPQHAAESNCFTIALLAALSSITVDTLKKTPTKQAIINALEAALDELLDDVDEWEEEDDAEVAAAQAEAKARYMEEEEKKRNKTVQAIEELVGQVAGLF